MSIVEEFRDLCLAKGAFQKEKITKQFNSINEDSKKVLERYLVFNKNHGCELEALADNYFFLCSETNKYQLQFYRDKQGGGIQLAHNSYADSVYMKKFMSGLAISTFLWPQHQKLYDFFCSFIDKQLLLQCHDASYLRAMH